MNHPKDYLLTQIRPSDLKAYLRNTGWVEEPSQQRYMLKFKSPKPINSDGKYINIFISRDESLTDYKRTVEYALNVISNFENADCNYIINRILNFSDCLKTRIIEAKKGLIPLNQGVSLYEGMLDLITYSACAEFEKKPAKSYPRKLERAIKYAETSLMGQSELGSYVANVYIPLKRPPDFPWDLSSPFPRRVVLRILRGLENLADSVSEDNIDPIISNYHKGLNSNMCDSLINIIDAGMGNHVIMSAVLEPAYQPPSDISTEFTLAPSNKRYLEAARDILAVNSPFEEEKEFFGYPEILSSPKEVEKGTIKLKSLDILKNRTTTIKIELNESEYQRAVTAHSGKKFIRIKGILVKRRGRWYLENPQKLEVLDEDSELPWDALDKSKKD